MLVDEFQDTDPVQWDIMRRAFGRAAATLVLIGDPKQAIYAFRGADVYAYLDAARAADARATLRVNWRSDQGLIDAYDALFGGARLGHEGIVYREVRAAGREPRRRGCPARRWRAAARPRRAPRRARRRAHAPGGVRDERLGARARSPTTSPPTSSRCCRPARRSSAATRTARRSRSSGSSPGTSRCSCARTATRRWSATRSRRSASRRSSTARAACSAPTPAREWLRLLEAIERPTSPPRARAAALTPFLGWTRRARSRAADDDEWEAVHRRLHGWARVLRERGVASLTEAITLGEGLPARVLATADGERTLTDLRHVGQLLHAAATAEQLGTTALTAWLRRRIAEAERDTGDEERSRRLESDAEAVQVLTIHRSKGLEFPIVYCPFLWEHGVRAQGRAGRLPRSRRRRPATLDVGLEGAELPAPQAAARSSRSAARTCGSRTSR